MYKCGIQNGRLFLTQNKGFFQIGNAVELHFVFNKLNDEMLYLIIILSNTHFPTKRACSWLVLKQIVTFFRMRVIFLSQIQSS